MRWSGATGAIARCKRVSTGCGRKRRSVPAWPWICGVKPTPKAVNKPSLHSIVHGLDKPGVFTTVSKTIFNPVPPLPRPDESRPADGLVETHDVELLLPGLTDHNERHGPIRRTGGPQPHITYSRHLLAVPPGPIVVLLQVVALDLSPIGQCEGVGTLPFHQEGALVGRRDMAHELRIAEPTIGHDQRRWQCHATSAERRQ